MRLWPMSRQNYPKQFLSLEADTRSLFQQTLQRLEGLAAEDPLIVTHERLQFHVIDQLKAMGYQDPTILLEPESKNTAASCLLAAFAALQHHPDACLLILPSDHLLHDTRALQQAIRTAYSLAQKKGMVTFGVEPTYPATGFGYIRVEKEALRQHKPAYPVVQFTEKPDQATAKNFLKQGGHYWNSGMFLFHGQTLLEVAKTHCPEVLHYTKAAWEGAKKEGNLLWPQKEAFARCPHISIDYAIMEKVQEAHLIPLRSTWQDVGNWERLWQTMEQDANGNHLQGDVYTQDVSGSIARSDDGLLALLGVQDIVAIQTRDATLIAPKHRAEEVKDLVASLQENGRKECQDHSKTYRPWGSYENLVQAQGFKVKRIIVDPGQRLSLQMHRHRAEHWVVVKGRANITRGEEMFELTEDASTYIPAGTKHRLENPGATPLEIIEVQSGRYLEEDDIVRLDDAYGRKTLDLDT